MRLFIYSVSLKTLINWKTTTIVQTGPVDTMEGQSCRVLWPVRPGTSPCSGTRMSLECGGLCLGGIHVPSARPPSSTWGGTGGTADGVAMPTLKVTTQEPPPPAGLSQPFLHRLAALCSLSVALGSGSSGCSALSFSSLVLRLFSCFGAGWSGYSG